MFTNTMRKRQEPAACGTRRRERGVGGAIAMRWLKHMTMAHTDAAIDAAEDKFGAEAYGVWWHILEDIAAPMEPCSAKFMRT